MAAPRASFFLLLIIQDGAGKHVRGMLFGFKELSGLGA